MIVDRCVTNFAVNNNLEGLKGDNTNRFKCALHPLDAMAKECSRQIKSYENASNVEWNSSKKKYPYAHHGESNTEALIHTISKLFYDVQFNCNSELLAHLKVADVVLKPSASVVYYRFVGNRFHILFLNAGLLYHYRNTLVQFFSEMCSPKNDIQHSVLNSLNIEFIPHTIRLLGLTSS